MQLLDTEQLECAFQAHGISMEAEARRFYGDVWSLIQAAEKIRDAILLSSCERDLRRACNGYFVLMRRWRQAEEDNHENEPVHPAVRANMDEAFIMLSSFERQFFRYALCYLELNRALIQMRGRLSFFARDYTEPLSENTFKINHSTGALLNRAHKNRKEVMEKRLRIERVRELLHRTDPLLERLGATLPHVMGHNEGNHQLTLFKGALRKQDFTRAETVIAAWKDSGMQNVAKDILLFVRNNASDLKAQDSLILHSGELSLIAAFLKSDEIKISHLVEKYNVPYMMFQYKNLLHQGYLLGRIGSLEGLIIHHAKLISLSARPHLSADMATVQEQSILIPARALLNEKFRTLGTIFSTTDLTVAVLEKLFAQTKDYMSNSPSKS